LSPREALASLPEIPRCISFATRKIFSRALKTEEFYTT
jgi:hypothetical protein